ncbi:hybrid sensor histidine kinase/response regulator [Sorangium sp. So ce233]|uniref:hybrid sensor histidine kinase/response regulator n=1 Tax=Sorangium sp. So ce233 TaxID=3133290 RepID=UPI003F61FD89
MLKAKPERACSGPDRRAASPLMPDTLPADGCCEEGQGAAELRLKAALLDQVSEAAFAWELGGTGGIVYFGPGAERLYGFSARDALGRSSHELLSTVFPVPLAHIEEALEREGRWAGELQHTARDGRKILLESRMNLVEGIERRRLVLETGRDITVRRRAEEGLRKGEERLRLALAGGQLGIWEWDVPSGHLFWSREAFDQVGVSEAQLGSSVDGFTRLLHPDDRDAVWAQVESALRGETDYSCEYRILDASGRERWVHSRALVQRDRDGRPLRMTGVIGDITSRKLAELALRESEARFRNMADHSPVMIWVTGSDGSCTYTNRGWLDFTGQPEAAALGFGWLDAVHPEERLAVAEAFLRASERGEAYRMDFRVRRRDGAYRWCVDSAAPRLGPRGEYLGYIGSIIDFTERKSAELLLQESEERLRRAVMAAPFPMMIHAEDGQIIILNRAWLDLSGYTREQIPTIEAWTARAHGPRQGVVRAAIDAVYGLEGKPIETEFNVTTASGAQRTWVFSGAPLGRDAAGRRLVISAAHDITERKRSDDALRESEARFRELADAMPQIVWTARPDGSMDYGNRQWRERTGTKEGEALGEGWVSFLHEDDRQRSLAAWHRAVVTGEPYEVEYRFGDAAGREHRWYLVRGVPVRGPEGDIVRWYGTCTDIHDQKCAEASLKEADQRKDEFLAMLAHELRNPLGPIRNAVEILRRVAGQLPPLARACGVIDRQVSHMARLVDDLLDVSRVARGRIPLHKERCDLSRLLRQTAEDYRSTLEASGLSLDLDLPDGPVWVSGDPTRLSQAVSNVLHNANKFTDAGGRVTVMLSTTSEGAAVIRIRDTGIGMDQAMLARMFEPFSQADRSLDRSQGGLGLGLALVQGLVELHGGAVSAESAGVGRGTEVVLRLPLSRGPESSPERAAPPPGVDPRSLRILIIEDNEDAAETLQALLSMDGYRVEVALSGRAGVDAARAFRPEVVLCDIGLAGGMDGYGVARALKELKESAKEDAGVAPSLMIALTGYGQEEDRRRVREAGFDMHLIKPIEPSSLQEILATFTAQA